MRLECRTDLYFVDPGHLHTRAKSYPSGSQASRLSDRSGIWFDKAF